MRGRTPVRAVLVVAVTLVLAGAGAEAAASNQITGTPGNDVLIGTPERDSISGLGGADVLRGRGSKDFLLGNAGDDDLWGDAGSDLIVGDAGDDELRGGDGADNLSDGERSATVGTDLMYGGFGPDNLRSIEGPDRLYGEGQNDGLITFSPNVIAVGGPGDDWVRAFYDEESSANGSTLRGAAGADLVETYVDDAALWGGDGNDTLHAFLTSGVRIVAGPGDDHVESNDGSVSRTRVNTIECGPGRDTVRVGLHDTVAPDCEVVVRPPS